MGKTMFWTATGRVSTLTQSCSNHMCHWQWPPMATVNRPVSVAQCSFVQRLVLPVKGTVLANAVLLADVDSDGENELILGTTDGMVFARPTCSVCLIHRLFHYSECICVCAIFRRAAYIQARAHLAMFRGGQFGHHCVSRRRYVPLRVCIVWYTIF